METDIQDKKLMLERLERQFIAVLKERVESLETQLKHFKCLLWAAAETAGGRLEVLDKHAMFCLDRGNRIVTYYDEERRATIIKAQKE